jgi:allophanate hydrolase subunit 1
VFLNSQQISSGLSNAQDDHITGMGDVKHAYKNVMIKYDERGMNFQHQIER